METNNAMRRFDFTCERSHSSNAHFARKILFMTSGDLLRYTLPFDTFLIILGVKWAIWDEKRNSIHEEHFYFYDRNAKQWTMNSEQWSGCLDLVQSKPNANAHGTHAHKKDQGECGVFIQYCTFVVLGFTTVLRVINCTCESDILWSHKMKSASLI